MTHRTNRHSLRSGFTTGACAAAAAKAAALSLKEQREVSDITITLPAGQTVSFPVVNGTISPDHARYSVIKDAGDDPDSTDGAEISATVSRVETREITLYGGRGVGIVTKPGLEISVGEPAINPVPRQMILNEVTGIFPEGGVAVEITVPDGEKLAKKTLNARLGIRGGISIIGTSGIVIPYSVEAYKTSISQSLDIAIAAGARTIVLSTGRRSEKYAQDIFCLQEESFVMAGDFIGHSLTECARRNIEKIIIWGMTGKISKLAHGDMYTNISDSGIDFNFLLEVAKTCGVPEDIFPMLKTSVTANQFRRQLPADLAGIFCERLCGLASFECGKHIDNSIPVSCVMSDYSGNVLGRNDD